MGLFVVSFLLVMISSYFLTSVISPKKNSNGFLYLPLFAFSQLVLTFEILSLFSAINQVCVLTFNMLFLVVSATVWCKKGKPIWGVDLKSFLNRVKNSFKLDKSLIFLFVGFSVFILTSVFLCSILPVINSDADAYHLARSVFWVINGNLNHFEIPDIRNLCLPINSEILYAWVLLFIKKNLFLGFFSFVGYLMSIVAIYGIMGLLGYCTRKKLWVIFILSSFSSVIVQVSGTETDIIIAGLIMSSIFLFWSGVKENKLMPIFMSSLAFALALGTKTPAIMAIPGVGLFFLAQCFYLNKKEPKLLHRIKPFGYFLGFGTLNFLVFSSFNYILNYLQFSNIMGHEQLMIVAKNYYGIKAIPANFVKYMFMFFDFTGFKWSDYIGPQIMHIRNAIIGFMHLGYVKDGLYSFNAGPNRTLLEPLMGAGILGFLTYLPCLFWALVKPLFKRKSKKTWTLFCFSILFIINLIVISYLLSYMVYSVRFIMSFIVLSSPILVYSYLSRKNPLKYVIVAFSLFYLIGVSTHLWARPFIHVVSLLAKYNSISKVREISLCRSFDPDENYTNQGCAVRKQIQKKYSKDDRIIIFSNSSDPIFLIATLMFDGYKIDFGNLEDAKKIDFDKYNAVIVSNHGQFSTFVKDYKTRKNELKITPKAFITKKGNTVPCMYFYNRVAPIKDVPYLVQCFITPEFVAAEHLRPVGVAGVVLPNTDINNIEYYLLFKKN